MAITVRVAVIEFLSSSHIRWQLYCNKYTVNISAYIAIYIYSSDIHRLPRNCHAELPIFAFSRPQHDTARLHRRRERETIYIASGLASGVPPKNVSRANDDAAERRVRMMYGRLMTRTDAGTTFLPVSMCAHP